MTVLERARPVPSLGSPHDVAASPPPRADVARGRRAGIAVVGLVLLAVAIVHMTGMWNSPARVDDEGTYVAQAWAVQTGEGLAHYTYWYDHPPVGWMQLAAFSGITQAFEWAPNSVAAGRVAMLLAKVISCWLLFLLARRLALGRATGIAAVVLFACNPLSIEFQRRVFLDNVATPWLLGAFVLALSPRRQLSAIACGGVCFGIAALSKETTLVLFPAFVLALWQHGDPRNRKFTVAVATVVAALTVAMYPIFAALNGELIPGSDHVSLWDAVKWQLNEREGSGNILDPSSHVRGLLRNWLQYDTWLLAVAIATTPFGLVARRLRPIALVVAIQVLMLLRGGYIPYPYVITVLPFAALLIAGLGELVWKWASIRDVSRLRRRVAVPARMALLGGVMASLVFVAPAWARGVNRQMTEHHDAGMTGAQQWVHDHVPRDAVVVVDDALWLDLVRDGRERDDVVWFYKLDLDPAIALEDGWRSIDYMVLATLQGDALGVLPTIATALEHAEVVASFGSAPDQVSIYEVKK